MSLGEAEMSVETDTRDRVIRMEAQFSSFKEEVRDDIGKQGRKIDEMYDVLTQAKGVKLFGVFMLAASSAFGGALVWAWNHLSFGRLP